MNPSTSAKKVCKIFSFAQPMHFLHILLHAEAHPSFFAAAVEDALSRSRLHARAKSVGFLPFSF